MSQRTRRIFEIRLRSEYDQRLSNIEGIHAIMVKHANTPERKRETAEWLKKGKADLDKWYRSRLSTGS